MAETMKAWQYSRRYRRKRLLYIYIVFLTILSASIILMPIGELFGVEVYNAVSGGLFWIGFIGVLASAIYITISRRRSRGFDRLYPNFKRFGPMHFFSNKAALIFDVLMFIAFIGFCIVCLLTENLTLKFVMLSSVIFSFGMHCMLNGSNYIYINYPTRREKES